MIARIHPCEPHADPINPRFHFFSTTYDAKIVAAVKEKSAQMKRNNLLLYPTYSQQREPIDTLEYISTNHFFFASVTNAARKKIKSIQISILQTTIFFFSLSRFVQLSFQDHKQ